MSTRMSPAAAPSRTGQFQGGPNRVLKGVPTAGQFAAARHGEGDLTLQAAPALPAVIRVPKQVYAAVKAQAATSIEKSRERSLRRKADRIRYGHRPLSTKAKIAVAGLVIVTAAGAGIAAADGGSVHVCQAAPQVGASVTATTAVFLPAPVIPHVAGPVDTGHGKDTIQWLHPGESCPAPAAPVSNT